MSSPRLRASCPSFACLAAALVFMIGMVSAAATILFNSLEPLVAQPVPPSLDVEFVDSADFFAKSVHSGHELETSFVSVSEKTFEDFQVLCPRKLHSESGRLDVDTQDFNVGASPINVSVVKVNDEHYFQDSNLWACDLSVNSTKVHFDLFSQDSVCAEVNAYGTLVNYLIQPIPVHVGLESPSDRLTLDTPFDKDHVVDLESGATAPPLALDFIQPSDQVIDVVLCVDCDTFQDGLLVTGVNQVCYVDTWMDVVLCWLASGCLLQDFLLLSTWASQVWLWLAGAKGLAWRAAAGLAQTFLVSSKWQQGKHPNSRKTKAPRLIRYCPGVEHQGDCFFACLAYAITGCPPSKAQVRNVRSATAALWRLAPQNLLDRTATKAGFPTADEYVSAIQNDAWGGMPDLLIWTQLLGLNAT
eukprot:428416-Amphidinium_carterae.1